MHIVFTHTPMATIGVEERRAYWRNFDVRYHAIHPGLRHMERVLWELPHWMTWLAGVLVQEGFDSLEAAELYGVECRPSGIDQDSAVRTLSACPGDVFLFSPMTPNLHFALEIAACAKRLYPNCVTVFGGVVATPLRREVARHPAVDYVVAGRGEYALPALLRALTGRDAVADVGNLLFQLPGGELYESPTTYPDMPPAQLPFPKVDLFPASTGRDLRYLRQVSGLGCPYRCSFCTIQTIGRRASYFPIPRVLAEIRAYRAHYGAHHNLYFGDETFTLDVDHTLELCAALADEGDVEYDCQTRLDCLQDPRLPDALYRSGCRWVEVGLEVANQKGQDAFKQRRVRMDAVEDRLARLRDAGLGVCSYLVNGFPNQTLDDMKGSIDTVCSFLDRGLLHASYLFGLVPYPGSRMYEDPGAFGMRLRHREHALYHEDLEPVFDTPHATAEQIHRVLLEGVRDLTGAMAGRPHVGSVPDDPAPERFGHFWAGSHN